MLNFTTDCLAWDTKGFKVLILLLFSSEMLMAAIPENLSLLMWRAGGGLKLKKSNFNLNDLEVNISCDLYDHMNARRVIAHDRTTSNHVIDPRLCELYSP